jgi:hypothetical protein
MLAASPLPTSRLARVRFPTGGAQVGLFFLAYLVYSAARYITVGDLASAQDHANWIMDLENSLGVAVESSVQTTLTGTWVLWLLNHAYLAAQLVVLPGSLIFLYRRSRPLYERLRNTILATWLISIPVYGLFPVAPPRLADSGLVDTISTQTGFAMDSSLTTSFYNELAAVPSLHVGFAFAVGMALAASFRNPLLKLAAHLWGPAIALAVVATGNHYVFDIVAGMVAAALGYGIGVAVARRGMQSTSAIRVPTTVSTVLVPMKNAARRSAGTALPATVSKLAASTATPAPTEAGANGTSRPLPWAKITSSSTAGVTGSAKAARKHASAPSLQQRLSNCQGSTSPA